MTYPNCSEKQEENIRSQQNLFTNNLKKCKKLQLIWNSN